MTTLVTRMPHDPEAEAGVIGGVLLRPELLALLPQLETDDFFDPMHKHLFAAMRNLEAAGKSIDVLTIGAELDTRGVRDLCEAQLGLAALRVPTPSRVEEYAEIIRGHRVSREVALATSALTEAVLNGQIAGSAAVAEAMTRITRIEAGDRQDRGRKLGDLVRDEFHAIESDNSTPTGIPSGLAALDKLIGGIPTSVPTLVMARPGHGKTTFAMALAWACSRAGEKPLVYSYEDGPQSFAQRAIAQCSGVATESIRARQFNQGDLSKIAATRRAMFNRSEIVVSAIGMQVDELVRDVKARRRRDPKTGRMVLVDYLQRMPHPRLWNGASKNDRLGEISKQLSDLAASEDIAVVELCQLNRDLEKRDDKVPKLADIRDCGEIEQDGKLALGLYRPSKYSKPSSENESGPPAPPTLLEIHVLKNHNGQDDVFAEAYWDLATHTICNSYNELAELRRGRHLEVA